jgi:hypothetical protein
LITLKMNNGFMKRWLCIFLHISKDNNKIFHGHNHLLLTQTWFLNKKYYKTNNISKPNGSLFKLLWAQKLQKQKDFQMTLTNHDKSRPSIK